MINNIINVTENDAIYNSLMDEISKKTDDDLVIVGRSEKNRKDDRIKPVEIKNGIYFYVAYCLNGKTAYLNNVTTAQIIKAKLNMVKRARVGSMIDVIALGGYAIDDYTPEADPTMVCATTDVSMFGAGLLYCEDFLKAIRSKIGDFYIIPSSIHELIFVPVDVMSKGELTHMVQSVNADMVTENEFLADRAFEVSEWI